MALPLNNIAEIARFGFGVTPGPVGIDTVG